MNKLFIYSIFLMFVLPVNAGTFLDPQTVKRIGMGWGAEGVYVSTNEGLSAEGCLESTARMSVTHPMLRENLSVLLSAFNTNTPVRLYVDGCSGNRMNLMSVQIEK